MKLPTRSYLLSACGVAFVLAGILLIAAGKSYQVGGNAAGDHLAPLLADGSIPCKKFLRYAQGEEAIRVEYNGNLKFDIE